MEEADDRQVGQYRWRWCHEGNQRGNMTETGWRDGSWDRVIGFSAGSPGAPGGCAREAVRSGWPQCTALPILQPLHFYLSAPAAQRKCNREEQT